MLLDGTCKTDFLSLGGVLRTVSKSVVSLIIPEGAHHLDLRAADPADPASVTKVSQLSFIKLAWLHGHITGHIRSHNWSHNQSPEM